MSSFPILSKQMLHMYMYLILQTYHIKEKQSCTVKQTRMHSHKVYICVMTWTSTEIVVQFSMHICIL